MKIYTKAGDLGETSLWGRAGLKRTRKDSLRVEAYGSVDEANAFVGLARSLGGGDARFDEMLSWVQHRMFALGADLSNINVERENRVKEADVAQIEAWIDQLDATLPGLKQFVLPGGAPAASALHVARTVVRRAERRLVRFLEEDASYSLQLKFLNRLSDFLFVAARCVNQAESRGDVLADF
jgi:cob(I)alamin adenosyltransferase